MRFFILISFLFTSIFLSGCAYQQYMHQEQARSKILQDQIQDEHIKTTNLASKKLSLEAEIAKLNGEINDLHNQIALQNEEINMLKAKTAKVNKDIVEVKNRAAQIKRLEGKLKEKEQAVALKKREVQKLAVDDAF